ncbi:MAG: hypothetical protein PVF70_01660 [Anaerolineales bacterium]|jgi:hypothetical protein
MLAVDKSAGRAAYVLDEPSIPRIAQAGVSAGDIPAGETISQIALRPIRTSPLAMGIVCPASGPAITVIEAGGAPAATPEQSHGDFA